MKQASRSCTSGEELLLHGEKGRGTVKTQPESAFWIGPHWVGHWALVDNRCACNWRIYSQRILVHSQKVPFGGARITKYIPASKPCVTDVLCDWQNNPPPKKMCVIILGPMVWHLHPFSLGGFILRPCLAARALLTITMLACFWVWIKALGLGSGTDKVPQRTFTTEILMNHSWCSRVILLALCYAGSGLPQGLLEETSSTSLKLSKKWGFRENPEMGLKWVKRWVLTHFCPPKPTFGPISAH